MRQFNYVDLKLQVTRPTCYRSRMKKRKKTSHIIWFSRSACPVANTLDLIGDKWTLLVVRDLLFLGKRLYGELVQSPEGVPSNILADRLKRLEVAGLLEKSPYQKNPVRHEYRLTPKGTDLFPVLKEIIHWGNKYVPGTTVPPSGFLKSFEKKVTAGRKNPGVKQVSKSVPRLGVSIRRGR